MNRKSDCRRLPGYFLRVLSEIVSAKANELKCGINVF
jgi:hypothetical protein